jgi:hypothetical protein
MWKIWHSHNARGWAGWTLLPLVTFLAVAFNPLGLLVCLSSTGNPLYRLNPTMMAFFALGMIPPVAGFVLIRAQREVAVLDPAKERRLRRTCQALAVLAGVAGLFFCFMLMGST